MASQYYYDPAADDDRLKRKRRLAEQMANRVWDPYSALHDAGPIKVANWGDAVGQLAKAWGSGRAERDLSSDETSTRNAQREYETQNISDYISARQGGTAQDTRAMDEQGEGATPTDVRVPGNKRKALALAMQSRIPSLITQAQKDMEEDRKLLNVPGATVASRAAASESSDPNLLRSDVKPQVVEGQGFNVPDTGFTPGQQPAIDPRTRWQPVPPPQGAGPGAYQQSDTGKVDVVGEPKGTNISIGDRRGNIIFEERVKGLGKSLDTAQKGARTFTSMAQALPWVKQSYTGSGAEVLLAGHKLLKLFNLSDDAIGKISTTETLRATLGKLVYDEIKNLGAGTGLSDADREFAMNASLASLSNDPRALENGIRIAMAGSLNNHVQHQNNLGQTIEAFPDEAKALTVYSQNKDPLMAAPGMEQELERLPNGLWQAKANVTGAPPGSSPGSGPTPGIPQTGGGRPNPNGLSEGELPLSKVKPDAMPQAVWDRLQELRQKRGY